MSDTIPEAGVDFLCLPLPFHCPKCKSDQFSINVPKEGMRPDEWSDDILGESDCRSCQKIFLVTIPEEIREALKSLLEERLRKKRFPIHDIKEISEARYPKKKD